MSDTDPHLRIRLPRPSGDGHIARLVDLVEGALNPPPGKRRIALALGVGVLTHLTFAAAVIAMIVAMGFGMSASFGNVPWPWALVANAALIVQFPVLHSLLLTRRGGRKLAVGSHGGTLATTTYALIASVQLFVLFVFWTPSGIVWWRAEGPWLALWLSAYAATWAFLMKASFDAGAEVQSGALGWMSLLAKRKPRFPDMPQTGTFRVIRQPIYLAFALTTWAVPVWTPDQLVLALSLSGYCIFAPILKERRFRARYGERFDSYAARTPYMIPWLSPKKGGRPEAAPSPTGRE